MKIGSVKFFKFVIVITFILIMLIPISLSVIFGVRSMLLANKLDIANDNIAQLTTKISEINDAIANQNDTDGLLPTSKNEANLSVSSFEYQLLYPDMYNTIPEPVQELEKVAYLTFDDGPSANTMKVLELLAENDIKATFFVTGPSSEAHPDYLKAVADAGHTIGVHSYSHKYTDIYASVDAYLADFEKMYTIIKNTTGVAPTVFRFPGGSINAYNSLTYMPIISEMTRRGFLYYDWNVSSGDVALRASQNEIGSNVLNATKNRERCIILMHDRLDTYNTISGLPSIISGLKEQGYIFKAITPEVSPITFGYHS